MRNVILDLAGGTGAWSRPYKEAGYDVRVITLPDYDVMQASCGMENVVLYRRADATFCDVPYGDIAGILCAPPCTEFSVAKGARPRDLAKGMEAVEACMRIIWGVQKRTKLDFWALENPRGLLRRFLGIPKFTFEQWQFGGDKIKPTDLWGYFNPPTPTAKARSGELTTKFPNGSVQARDWGRRTCPPEYEEYINQFHGDERRAAVRAITPAGFAEAFFRANHSKGESNEHVSEWKERRNENKHSDDVLQAETQRRSAGPHTDNKAENARSPVFSQS
jgi:hypothetical protein